MKNWTHAKTGALKGHSIPNERWDTLHLDFITDLQPTKEGFDAILVCTDRLSRYTYLIPAKKVDFYHYGTAVIPDGVLGTWTSRPTYY